jgi:hypothetical protein
VLAKDVLGGARLACDFREAQEKRLGQSSALNAIDTNGLLTASRSCNRRVSSGLPRKTSSSFSTFL